MKYSGKYWKGIVYTRAEDRRYSDLRTQMNRYRLLSGKEKAVFPSCLFSKNAVYYSEENTETVKQELGERVMWGTAASISSIISMPHKSHWLIDIKYPFLWFLSFIISRLSHKSWYQE